MKKLLALVLALTMMLTLAACGHECVFADATCTAPRTCAECGATEGEPLGHTLTEANYQTPATCTVCGETEGEPVAAEFESLNYPLMEIGKEYDYVTVGMDPGADGVYPPQQGKVSVQNYRVVPSEEGLEAKEGYEWRIAELNFSFTAEDVERCGYRFVWGCAMYYEGDCFLADDFSVNWNGQDYDGCLIKEEVLENGIRDDGSYGGITQSAVRVPVGYDGIILVNTNPTWHPDIGGVMPEHHISSLAAHNPLCFRMN